MHAFDVLKATPLLDDLLALGGASPIDPATLDEPHDLVELARSRNVPCPLHTSTTAPDILPKFTRFISLPH